VWGYWSYFRGEERESVVQPVAADVGSENKREDGERIARRKKRRKQPEKESASVGAYSSSTNRNKKRHSLSVRVVVRREGPAGGPGSKRKIPLAAGALNPSVPEGGLTSA